MRTRVERGGWNVYGGAAFGVKVQRSKFKV